MGIRVGFPFKGHLQTETFSKDHEKQELEASRDEIVVYRLHTLLVLIFYTIISTRVDALSYSIYSTLTGFYERI